MKYEYVLNVTTPGFIRIRSAHFTTPASILITKDEKKYVEGVCKALGYAFTIKPIAKKDSKVTPKTTVKASDKVTVSEQKKTEQKSTQQKAKAEQKTTEQKKTEEKK